MYCIEILMQLGLNQDWIGYNKMDSFLEELIK